MKRRASWVLLVVCSCLWSCEKNHSPEDAPRVDYLDCVVPGSNNLFEVVTFNMKEFPVKGDETILYVSELLMQMNADVVAVQEISTATELAKLAEAMPGWKSLFSPVPSWSMSLGYLYKTSEIELMADETEVLFEDDTYLFPRGPLQIKVRHLPSNQSTYLINLHLKCCGGSENESRRRGAAEKLKTHIDVNLSVDHVIVLGDYNDRIDGSNEAGNVFWNFVSDVANYRFADGNIATGSTDYWSYPSYPSHLDHLLITNEWFNSVDTVFTTRPDACVSNFRNVVGDHRPVVLVLKSNN